MRRQGSDAEPIAAGTDFFGRREELAKLTELVRKGSALITLLGPGGMGKTRLCVELAGRLRPELGEPGIWFCDLVSQRTAEGVAAAVSGVLGVPLVLSDSPDAAITQVGRALRSRGRALIVLDNFEQAATSAGQVVADWHASAPEARFIVTSRQALGIDGEVCVELQSLDPESALALFLARAREALPNWAPSPEEEATLGEVVDMLDRIPLALELAAPRLRMMSVATLKERLSDRFALLSSTRRDKSARHANLGAVLDGSWDLLNDAERRALAQCSVFAGGFSLQAAEAVVRFEPGSSVMDVLLSLREKSLIFARDAASDRLGLYESIRAYARQKLTESDEEEPTLARHTSYFLELGERLAPLTRSRNAARALAELALEQQNLEAVQQRESERHPELKARAVLAQGPLFRFRGPLHTHIQILREAVGAARSVGATELEVRALVALGDAQGTSGRTDDATDNFARAEELLGTIDSPLLACELDIAQGNLRITWSRYDEALPLFQRALASSLSQSDLESEGYARAHIGVTQARRGELVEAKSELETALTFARRLENPHLESLALSNLGMVETEDGLLDPAERRYRQALALDDELGTWRMKCSTLANLGCVLCEQGDSDEARRTLTSSLDLSREIGHRRVEGLALINLGILDHRTGRLDAAAEALSAAAEIYREIGNAVFEAVTHSHLGAVRARQNRRDEARSEFDAARRLRSDSEELGATHDLLEGFLDLADGRNASDAPSARTHFTRARKRLEAVLSPSNETTPPLRSSAVRDAAYLLSRALGDLGGESSEVTGSEGPAAHALVVGKDTQWIRPPGSAQIDLRSRNPIRLLLARLIAEHARHSGSGVSTEELFSAGWPGEHARTDSAQNRVWVALASLRRMGLRGVIQRDAAGYFLDPSVPVVTDGSNPD